MNLHPELFPRNWIRLPVNGLPIRLVPGPVAGIQRRIVRKLYARARFPYLADPSASDDDHWLSSVSLWLRQLQVVKHHAFDEHVDPIYRQRVRKMSRCGPSGYLLANPTGLPWRYCYTICCPFCYARSVSTRYRLIMATIKLAPPGAPLWLASFSSTGARRNLSYHLRKRMIAGAVSVSVPTGRAPDEWLHRALLVTDRRDRVSDLNPRPLKGAHQVARLLADTLSYPSVWRGRPKTFGAKIALNAVLSLPRKTPGKRSAQYLGVFGPIQNRFGPHDPNRSAVGFWTKPK